MNISDKSILAKNIVLCEKTIYFGINYLEITFSNNLKITQSNQIIFDEKSTVKIDYGSDLTTLLEALRDVFESKYINKTSTIKEKLISRKTVKIVYNSGISNGEAFFNVIKIDMDV